MTMVDGPFPFVLFHDPPALAARDAPVEREASCDGISFEYFEARERAEKAAAKVATSLAARRIHQELAQIYGALARQSVTP